MNTKKSNRKFFEIKIVFGADSDAWKTFSGSHLRVSSKMNEADGSVKLQGG